MADFFEDLGRKISDVANDIGKKTEDTIEIQKLKSDMRTLRRANDRDLMDMGRMVYGWTCTGGDFPTLIMLRSIVNPLKNVTKR